MLGLGIEGKVGFLCVGKGTWRVCTRDGRAWTAAVGMNRKWWFCGGGDVRGCQKAMLGK